MAGLNELAIGIATALSGVAPNRLPVQLSGLSIDQAAHLVRRVIQECSDAGIHLSRVEVDADLFTWLTTADRRPITAPMAIGQNPGEVQFFRC